MNEDYQRLRGELEAAYKAAVWDTASLDRITAQLADVEWALASNAHSGPAGVQTAEQPR